MYFPIEYHDSAYPADGLAVQNADVHALNDICDSRGAQSLIDVARSTTTWRWDDLGQREILKSQTAQTSWVGSPKIPANLLGSCPRRTASEPNSRLLWPAQGVEWCWSQAGHSSSACAAIAEQYRCMCDQMYHGQNLVYGCIWGMVLGLLHNVYSINELMTIPHYG